MPADYLLPGSWVMLILEAVILVGGLTSFIAIALRKERKNN